ncbi:MAG: PEP/pyruvate-binding domain-containing protein [Gammaproteobacteria bacterium]|jgi:hypothetical protein|nr:PEP/pyruvate-binding domain-containing protein [Gammaproteobacteria bacterium]
MMKHFSLIILSVALLLPSTVSFAQSSTTLNRAVNSLNTERDIELSWNEIQLLPSILSGMDTNNNGILDSYELGLGDAGLINGLTEDVILGAIDQDGDWMLSAEEIALAGWSLLALDKDNSGSLINQELVMPESSFGGRGGGGGFGRGRSGNTRTTNFTDPADINPQDGLAALPNREAFERLSYQGEDVSIDIGLINQEYVKFIIAGANTGNPTTYFMNTLRHRNHSSFMRNYGMSSRDGMGENDGRIMRGVLVYWPLLSAPNGEAGLYTYEFEPFDRYPYDLLQTAHDELINNAPILADKLAYHPMPAALNLYESQRDQFAAGNLSVFLDEDEFSDIAYLPLNEAEGFGILRLMELDERPGSRDVVLYKSLPNEMPHVAGIITGFRQTPLSHVNLRAVQDSIPNAYIRNATEQEAISNLIGRYVYYRVAADGYEIREANSNEVEEFYANLRPTEPQLPERDLSVTTIRPLADVGFTDSINIGVKAANVATLRTLDFPAEAIPDGFAIPFYFYDEFMQHNNFYNDVERMLALPSFNDDADERERVLEIMRDGIEDGDMPAWMMNALAEMQNSFPESLPIRLRSSTNNEDLPGFSGAGLYDSYTHRPSEGHIAKSVKQVFASLWNFRAFEEREFYKIDHFSAAMGILVHPNYDDEAANGVAVSDDIVYEVTGVNPGRTYYVNVQAGEDLVTNPNQESIPEEILLNSVLPIKDRQISSSNRTQGELLLTDEYRVGLRDYMNRIHNGFRELYEIESGEEFAMEIEFKITLDGVLAIKQARPWVY